MRKRAKPIIHARDHEHGGADPIRIQWEDVGGGGSGGGGGIKVMPFSVSGELTTFSPGLRWYAPEAGVIAEVHTSLGSPPFSNYVRATVMKNDSDWIGSAEIYPGEYTNIWTPEDMGSEAEAIFAAGDFFSVYVDRVGPTDEPGSDLVVQLRFA